MRRSQRYECFDTNETKTKRNANKKKQLSPFITCKCNHKHDTWFVSYVRNEAKALGRMIEWPLLVCKNSFYRSVPTEVFFHFSAHKHVYRLLNMIQHNIMLFFLRYFSYEKHNKKQNIFVLVFICLFFWCIFPDKSDHHTNTYTWRGGNALFWFRMP